MSDLKRELQTLPCDWRLVRVGRDKAPIAGNNWFNRDDYSPDDAAELNGSGPPAWGLKCGPASGGVLVLDLDAHGWRKSFQEVTGHPFADLPRTIGWSSGKPDRSGHAFSVDREWWDHLANRRHWCNPDGETAWELRWDRCQSVIIGAHPETGRYRWLPDRSPADIPDPAPAPDWLLEALLIQEHPDAEPVEPTAEDADRALAMLALLPPADFSDYSNWVRVGMALHHTDPGLLQAWVDWSREMPNFDGDECLQKWASFGKSHKGRPVTIATLHHIAKGYDYQEPRKPRRGRRKAPAAAAGGDGPGAPQQGVSRGKRLDPDEVLALLPQRLGTFRLNVRNGDIHAGDRVLSGNELSRLYLELSNPQERWPKEPTCDAAALLASRSPFDPVADYLVSLQAAPLPMEQWQHLDQHLLGTDDPVAASFLPRYLVSAVARVFDPGCYVRQTPVLIGPEERGKSALGRILFGDGHWVEGVGKLSRDDLLKAKRAWGVELAELDGVTRRSDAEALKAFLTEQCDTYRAPYDRSPEDHPRRFVFWGTSNAPPLRHSGGWTRFVCIPVPDQPLPLAWAQQHRDAIWARAVERYRSNVPWVVSTEEERQAIGERNADFRELDPWADTVGAYLLKRKQAWDLPVKVSDVLDHLKVGTEHQTNALAKRIRELAEQHGWQHDRRRLPGAEKAKGLWPPLED